MTVPEMAIAVLLAPAFLYLVLRTCQVFLGNGQGMRAGFETGASKTIGDRETQEDVFGIRETEDGVMAVLADGMGKSFGGKLAAETAVEAFLQVFEDETAFYNPQYSFRKAFNGANRGILKRLNGVQGCASVTAVMIKGRKLYYAAAGNVKAAVYRNRELVPVSSGHTISALAQKKYEEGRLTREEALSLLGRHRLYNFVGRDGFKDIEFFDAPISLYGGEYVVLMSDGLYETARWKDMEDCLEDAGDCQKKAYALIELVNRSQAADRDNASAVLVKCR